MCAHKRVQAEALKLEPVLLVVVVRKPFEAAVAATQEGARPEAPQVRRHPPAAQLAELPRVVKAALGACALLEELRPVPVALEAPALLAVRRARRHPLAALSVEPRLVAAIRVARALLEARRA